MNKDELAKKEYEDLSIKAGRLMQQTGKFYSATELSKEMEVSVQKARAILKWLIDNRRFEVEIKLNAFKRRTVKVIYERKQIFTKSQLWEIALGVKQPKAA